MSNKTLREISGLPSEPAPISKSALVLIDCQNTYREGIMQLEGVEPALEECREILQRFRNAGRPIVHIRHDAGPNTPYDVNDTIGAIADIVSPGQSEEVVTKKYPSSFEQTNLDDLLQKEGVEDLVLAGFMTHVCVNSTARAAFNKGYRSTVIGSATATRSLPMPGGENVEAEALHNASLAALNDMFAIVVPKQTDIPD